MVADIANHAGLSWLAKHSPIFAKMLRETEERKKSEDQYKKLKPAVNIDRK